MDSTRVQQLLDKYYNGHTSLHEEHELKSFFNGDVPDEFQVDKQLFMHLQNEMKTADPQFNVAASLNQLIDEQEEIKVKTIPYRRVGWWVYRFAATVAIIFSVYLAHEYIISPQLAMQEEKELKDTFENPELAYLETKKALLYLSANLNKGTEELKNLDKFNQSIEQLTKLSEIEKARNLLMQDDKPNNN